MKKYLAHILAIIIYALLRLIIKLPDKIFILLNKITSKTISYFNPDDFRITVLNDVNKIFADASSSELARRMVTDARPEQVKAVIRGMLW